MIKWISEIWQEFDENAIVRSFDACGLTTTNQSEYHRQLRHFVEENEFVEDIIDEDEGDDDLAAFIDDDSEDSSVEDEDEEEEDEDEHDEGIFDESESDE